MRNSVRAMVLVCLGLAALGTNACEPASPSDPAAADRRDAANGSPSADAATDQETAADASALRRCRPGPGATGRPSSIDEALALVNSLPRPVTVTCFLESLDRPLNLSATYSTISLQPAAGLRSPRIFLLTDKLVMSIVVDGKGRNLVEFGQYVTPSRTLKGEIAFPALAEVPAGEPYARIQSNNTASGAMGTSCRFCHPEEEAAPQLGGAIGYVSGAFKPDWRTHVSLESVHQERQACDPAIEPDRCELLGALLDHGPVVETAFPMEVPSIFH
jgi:hypothetical protein